MSVLIDLAVPLTVLLVAWRYRRLVAYALGWVVGYVLAVLRDRA